MQGTRAVKLKWLMNLLAVGLLIKVTIAVTWGYRDYFPPDFASPFLFGRESYFFGAYRWAFYAHLLAGPLTLVLGLILISERIRVECPAAHRMLGKCQVRIVLFILAPSGLWMARYAETGGVAAAGFSLLAVATGQCALLGWRAAVARKFDKHRRWMWRCFLLLCSAVVLRLLGGLAAVTKVEGAWSYQFAAWASWFAPLAVFELIHLYKRWPRALFDQNGCQSTSSSPSLPAIEISV